MISSPGGQRVPAGGSSEALAPAAADVGLAIGTGTEMAIEATGITLISGSLADVVSAIALPRATMRNAQTRLSLRPATRQVRGRVKTGPAAPSHAVRVQP